MASIGLRRFRYGQLNLDGLTYKTPATLAGAIESSFTPNMNEASLFSDDAVKERASLYKDGDLTLGVDNDDEDIFAPLLGKRVETETFDGVEVKKYISGGSDTPTYIGFGQVIPVMIDNVIKYKVEFLHKVQFKPFQKDYKTMGDSLEFTTPSVSGKVLKNINNDYKIETSLFDDEEVAYAYLDSLFIPEA